jgi:hypothetical protein
VVARGTARPEVPPLRSRRALGGKGGQAAAEATGGRRDGRRSDGDDGLWREVGAGGSPADDRGSRHHGTRHDRAGTDPDHADADRPGPEADSLGCRGLRGGTGLGAEELGKFTRLLRRIGGLGHGDGSGPLLGTAAVRG